MAITREAKPEQKLEAAMGRLRGFGYSGRTVEELQLLSDDLEAPVIDTRYKPSSRDPQWNKSRLEKNLRGYLHYEGLGNLNYQGGEVRLADPERFLTDIAWRLLEGQNVILMCVCREESKCHRAEIRRQVRRVVMRRLGMVMREFERPLVIPVRQGGLFEYDDDGEDGRA